MTSKDHIEKYAKVSVNLYLKNYIKHYKRGKVTNDHVVNMIYSVPTVPADILIGGVMRIYHDVEIASDPVDPKLQLIITI